MQVSLQLKLEAALALQRGMSIQVEASDVKEFLRTIKDIAVTPRPMHPGATDPLLVSFFVIDVPDEAAAGRVIDRLTRLEVVEAAYLKPPDELP